MLVMPLQLLSDYCSTEHLDSRTFIEDSIHVRYYAVLFMRQKGQEPNLEITD